MKRGLFLWGPVLGVMIGVLSCATPNSLPKCPPLVLDHGWSAETGCYVDGVPKACKCMVKEDVERLRVWLVLVQETMCRR